MEFKYQTSLIFLAFVSAILINPLAISYAFADDDDDDDDDDGGYPEIFCNNEILSGNLNGKLTVSGSNTVNVCELDGVTLKGNIDVEENALLIIHGASSIDGNINLKDKFSELSFEGDSDINTLKGNIKSNQKTSFIFLEALTMDGNIESTGEIYISSFDEFSGPVIIDGKIKAKGSGGYSDYDDDDGYKKSKGPSTSELTINGGTILGNVEVTKQLSVSITNAVIDGNVNIKDNENTSDLTSSIIVVSNTIDGELKVEKNSINTILVSNNNISESSKKYNDDDDDGDNSKGGNLDVKNNKNTSDLTSSIVVTSNTIDGELKVEKNGVHEVIIFENNINADKSKSGHAHIKDNKNTSDLTSSIVVTSNTIDGHLKVEKNSVHEVIIFENNVNADNSKGGNLDVKDNKNTSDPTSSITIESNTVDGNLKVEKNKVYQIILSDNDVSGKQTVKKNGNSEIIEN